MYKLMPFHYFDVSHIKLIKTKDSEFYLLIHREIYQSNCSKIESCFRKWWQAIKIFIRCNFQNQVTRTSGLIKSKTFRRYETSVLLSLAESWTDVSSPQGESVIRVDSYNRRATSQSWSDSPTWMKRLWDRVYPVEGASAAHFPHLCRAISGSCREWHEGYEGPFHANRHASVPLMSCSPMTWITLASTRGATTFARMMKASGEKISGCEVSVASPGYRARKLTFTRCPSRNRSGRRLRARFEGRDRDRMPSTKITADLRPHANEKAGPLGQWAMGDNSIIDYHARWRSCESLRC